MELPRLNGAKVANEWQPMSALMWVGPSSRCISLMALNTGRSGQPVQKFGGRAGMSPTAAIAPGLWASIRLARAASSSASMPDGARRVQERGEPVEHRLRGVFAGLGRQSLPSTRVWMSARRNSVLIACLDVVGIAFLDHQHGALADAELAQLLRHQRIDDVEHVDRDARSRRRDRRGRAARARAARCW